MCVDVQSQKEWRHLVSADVTWIYHNTSETTEWSKQGTPSESKPKKPKVGLSVNEVMVTVLWDAHGIIYIDNLEKGKVIEGVYYAEL